MLVHEEILPVLRSGQKVVVVLRKNDHQRSISRGCVLIDLKKRKLYPFNDFEFPAQLFCFKPVSVQQQGYFKEYIHSVFSIKDIAERIIETLYKTGFISKKRTSLKIANITHAEEHSIDFPIALPAFETRIDVDVIKKYISENMEMQLSEEIHDHLLKCIGNTWNSQRFINRNILAEKLYDYLPRQQLLIPDNILQLYLDAFFDGLRELYQIAEVEVKNN